MNKKQTDRMNKVKTIIYILAIIGIINVIDNSIRLGVKVVNGIKNHQWTTVVIK
jgi:hypothetical protein